MLPYKMPPTLTLPSVPFPESDLNSCLDRTYFILVTIEAELKEKLQEAERAFSRARHRARVTGTESELTDITRGVRWASRPSSPDAREQVVQLLTKQVQEPQVDILASRSPL